MPRLLWDYENRIVSTVFVAYSLSDFQRGLGSMKKNSILKYQIAAGLVFQRLCGEMSVSREDFAFAFAESLGKSGKDSTILGYFQKVPKKFLVSTGEYKKFRDCFQESVEKMCDGGYIYGADVEANRTYWNEHEKEILELLDRIHNGAVKTNVDTVNLEYQRRIENILSD